MDVDAIPIGEEFPPTIRRQLDQCDAMVVVIGLRWPRDWEPMRAMRE
jgi:hypothetical protein